MREDSEFYMRPEQGKKISYSQIAVEYDIVFLFFFIISKETCIANVR